MSKDLLVVYRLQCCQRQLAASGIERDPILPEHGAVRISLGNRPRLLDRQGELAAGLHGCALRRKDVEQGARAEFDSTKGHVFVHVQEEPCSGKLGGLHLWRRESSQEYAVPPDGDPGKDLAQKRRSDPRSTTTRAFALRAVIARQGAQ